MGGDKKILDDIPEDWGASDLNQPQCNELKSDECDAISNMKLWHASEELTQFREVHGLRKCYLFIAFAFVVAFSVATFWILRQVGYGKMNLTPSVLIALLTTTMANVIGVLYIAFNWLFPRSQNGVSTEL